MTSDSDPFDGLKRTGSDAAVEEALEAHFQRYGVSPLDAVKHFMVFTRRQWLKRFLAHTELFKLTLEVPGDIAELGVFRGMGLFTWANLLESYSIGNRTKTVYGFDNWQGFTEVAPQDQTASDDSGQKFVGGFSPATHKQELQSAIDVFDSDRFVPWKPRVVIVDGDIVESVPQFVMDNPGVRFSLVHFDCDMYAPTRAALEALWPKISRGGLILFDEYAIQNWPGETQAVDEFLLDKSDCRLQTLAWNNVPAAYLIKP